MHAPPLDAAGNSVKGQPAMKFLSWRLGMDLPGVERRVREDNNSAEQVKENAVKTKLLFLLAAFGFTIASATIGGRAEAGAFGVTEGLRAAADRLAITETVQFIWNGRRYCWYPGGWRGPGWYWCGYAWRRGFGWGGPAGWHGWRRPGINRPGMNRPGVNRPGLNRPGGNRPGVGRPGGNRPGANRPGGNRPGVNRPGGNRPGANRPGGNRSAGTRAGRSRSQ